MKKTIRDLLLILAGGLLFALGINYFTLPNLLSEGGIIGITIIAHYLFDWSPSTVNFILNMVLLGLGYKFFDKRSILYTIFSIVTCSFFLHITEDVGHTLTDDTLLAAIFAGLLVGVGLGMIFVAGGTNGGTTVLARLANQLWGLSIGKGMLLIDIAVIAASIFIIGLEKAMFTLVTVYIGAKAIDIMVAGLNERVAVLVISSTPELVLEGITTGMLRGVTVLEGRGGYSGVSREVLYIVISKQEVVRMKRIVTELDGSAYVTIHNVQEVVGRGYKASKVS